MELKLIKTEEQYQKYMNRIDEIFHAKPGTKESDELEILVMLVPSELNFHHLSRTLLHIDFFIRWSNSNGYSPASFIVYAQNSHDKGS